MKNVQNESLLHANRTSDSMRRVQCLFIRRMCIACTNEQRACASVRLCVCRHETNQPAHSLVGLLVNLLLLCRLAVEESRRWLLSARPPSAMHLNAAVHGRRRVRVARSTPSESTATVPAWRSSRMAD